MPKTSQKMIQIVCQLDDKKNNINNNNIKTK